MVNEQVSNSIDYSATKSNHGDYAYSMVFPLSSPSVTLINSTVQTQFEIPNRVYNLNRSLLTFRLQVNEPTGGTGYWNHLNCDAMSFLDNMSIVSREGVMIAGINNVNDYTGAVGSYLTKMDEFLEKDAAIGSSTSMALAKTLDKGSFLFRSDDAGDATPTINLGPNGTRIGAGVGTTAPVAEAANISYTEPTYFKQCKEGNGAAQGACYCNFAIPLKDFYHTICSDDQDLYFNQSIVLNLFWANIAKLGWVGTSATAIETGAGQLTGDITVSDIRLLLACEQNPDLINDIVTLVNKQGMSIPIPYVHSYLYSSPVSTASTMQQKVNLSHGRRMLNYYSFVANNNTSNGLYNYDISNNNPAADGTMAKVLTTDAFIGSQNLFQFTLQENNNDLYDLMRPLLKGSVIQSSNHFRHKRLYCQSFRDGPMVNWLENDGSMIDGKSLETEQNIVINQTTQSAAYRNFLYIITQRQLNIMPNGIVSLS